jgi:hypothetical protein
MQHATLNSAYTVGTQLRLDFTMATLHIPTCVVIEDKPMEQKIQHK